MTPDELRSQLYEWLGRNTASVSGDEWEHGALRAAVERLLPVVREAIADATDAAAMSPYPYWLSASPPAQPRRPDGGPTSDPR